MHLPLFPSGIYIFPWATPITHSSSTQTAHTAVLLTFPSCFFFFFFYSVEMQSGSSQPVCDSIPEIGDSHHLTSPVSFFYLALSFPLGQFLELFSSI